MGLAVLVAGLALFVGVHIVPTRRALRGALVARFGEAGYKVLFGVVAIVSLALIVCGFGLYRQTGWIDIWYPPVAMRHIALALILPAIIFIAASYLRGRIYTTLKHPMLAGIKLWAFAHLLANGDLGSILLFGSILGWAVYDRISLKRRTDTGAPAIPVGGVGNDALAVVVGAVAYLALALVFHPVAIGVRVM